MHKISIRIYFSSNSYPLWVIIFYVLAPVPILVSRCVTRGDVFATPDAYTGRCLELAVFLTTCIVVSAYALPVLMGQQREQHRCCWLYYAAAHPKELVLVHSGRKYGHFYKHVHLCSTHSSQHLNAIFVFLAIN